MPISSTHSLSDVSTGAGRFLFLRKFLRHGTQVASITPSSRSMAQALCQHIEPERRQTILELGAGAGAVTTVAAKRMHPHSTLLAVEMDRDFTQILHRRCPEAYVIEADAAMTCARLQILGINQVDLIISGLPIPSLPQKVNQQIFQCIEQIIGEGYFSQLTVIPWVYLDLYRRLFHEVSFRPVWWNIPCGGVYHCRHLRADFLRNLPGKSHL
jgi:phosphatidylethanolamine/phosphatidyl-N-methylethanolamine N-methyltransferase